MAKRSQQPLHQSTASGIDPLDGIDLPERVGNIAPAAARHGHFGQRFASGLPYVDLCIGLSVLDLDGGEASGSATAYDSYLHRLSFSIRYNLRVTPPAYPTGLPLAPITR